MISRLCIVCVVLLFSWSAIASDVTIGFSNDVDFWTYPKIHSYLDSSRNTKVILRSYASGCDLLRAMRQGAVDIAYMDVPLMYQVQMLGLPYETTATAVTRASNDQGRVTHTSLLVALAGSGVVSVRGVTGKKVGVVPWTLSGAVIPQILFQQVGVFASGNGHAFHRYHPVKFSSYADAKAALRRGDVDVVGYPAVDIVNPQHYGVFSSLENIPNAGLVVATAKKDSASIQDILALLNSIPKGSQFPGLGHIMRFASPQSVPYRYWMKQMSQSGLFTDKACSIPGSSSSST